MARKKLLSEGEIRQFMKLANLRPIGAGRLSEMGAYPGARDEDEELGDELGATEDELGAEDALADEEGAELDVADDELAADEAGGGMVSMEDFMSALERAIEEVTGEEADVSEEPGDEEVEVDAEMTMGPEGEEEEVAMGAEEEMMQEIIRRLMERQKYGGNEGDIPDADRKKKGHYGRGGKTRETAEEEGEADYKELDEITATGRGYEAGERRSPRRQPRQPDEEDSDAPLIDEPSEMLPGSEYDPSEEIPRSKRGAKGRYRRDESMDAIVNEVSKRVTRRLQAQSQKEQMVDQLAERIMKRLTK